jgi:outer membrane protein
MELAEKLNALKMRYVQDQQTLAVDEAKVTKPIIERMNRILQSMGREQKWTLILERSESSVLFAEASLDLTNELIRRFNAGEGKK